MGQQPVKQGEFTFQVWAWVLYIAVSWSFSDQISISLCLRAAVLVSMP